MITGTEAANNVGVIFKIDNKPIIFYDAELIASPRHRHHKTLPSPPTIIA